MVKNTEVIDSIARATTKLIYLTKQLTLQAASHLFHLISLKPCTVFLPVSRVLPRAYWATAVSVLSTATGFSSFNLSTWLLAYLFLSSIVSEHQGKLKLATIHDVYTPLSLYRLFRELPEKTQAVFVFLCSTASLSLAQCFLQSPVLHDLFARLSLCRLLYSSPRLTISPKSRATPSGQLNGSFIPADHQHSQKHPRDSIKLVI